MAMFQPLSKKQKVLRAGPEPGEEVGAQQRPQHLRDDPSGAVLPPLSALSDSAAPMGWRLGTKSGRSFQWHIAHPGKKKQTDSKSSVNIQKPSKKKNSYQTINHQQTIIQHIIFKKKHQQLPQLGPHPFWPPPPPQAARAHAPGRHRGHRQGNGPDSWPARRPPAARRGRLEGMGMKCLGDGFLYGGRYGWYGWYGCIWLIWLIYPINYIISWGW